MGETKERFNPDEVKELDEIIRGSYNDFVRLERRNLLLSSSVIIIAAISGLNPSKGTLFGFSFENMSPAIFYSICVVITIYFLVAFLIYSVPTYRDAKQTRQRILSGSGTLEYQRPWYSLLPPNIGSDGRYYIWVLVHFGLPVLLGVASCVIGVVQIFLTSCSI